MDALAMLADLAAMKSGAKSTAYDGPMDEPKKKKKKKKKKGGKKSASKDSKPKASTSSKPKASASSKPKGALDMLADLAAMKSGAMSTAYVGGKKSKKKKKKGGKKSKKSKEVPTDIPSEDEKTPEPPSNLTEIEKRKFKLKYARRKLERRKRERDKVRAAKALKSSTDPNSSTAYGKSFIDKFMKQLDTEQTLNKKKITDAIKLEEEEERKKQAENDLLSGLGLNKRENSENKAKICKSLHRKPGRINTLNICSDRIDHGYVVEKKIETSDKKCQTESIMFERYLREEFMDDFNDANGNPISMNIKVIAGLIESTLSFGYPRELWELEGGSMASSPSPTAQKIRTRQRAEDERKLKIKFEKERRKKEKEAEKERRKNLLYMNRNDAEKLISRGDFLVNFKRKCKWIERTLGTNIENMELMRDEMDEFFEDSSSSCEDDINNNMQEQTEEKDDEKSDEKSMPISRRESVLRMKQSLKKQPKNYLKLRKTFVNNTFSGRAVGNISFSLSNKDWFAATYFIAHSKYNMTESNGCIGIWNFMLPTYPEYLLKSQNMITSTHFHPTDPFLIFGSTINGQILMWDLRINNKTRGKPIERSNFSNGHSSPVFTMSFLPTMSTANANKKEEQVQHILSVSNDGKLCIWRTDQLSVKPVTQNILKPSDDQSTARQIELITTCFDYSYRDATQVILGSDEGYLYKAEIFTGAGGGSGSDGQHLNIKESIVAHYGPITRVQFFPKYSKNLYNFKENVSGLYLTSSYDWTVKLWHQKIGKSNVPINVFDQMTDYVYDVKWNNGGKPGVFACCDGDGQINIFDLTRDFKHPLLTKNPIQIHPKNSTGGTSNIYKKSSKRAAIAATTLQWTYDGKYLACGDSDGNILFYNVHKSIAKQTLESCEAFQSVANKYIV